MRELVDVGRVTRAFVLLHKANALQTKTWQRLRKHAGADGLTPYEHPSLEAVLDPGTLSRLHAVATR